MYPLATLLAAFMATILVVYLEGSAAAAPSPALPTITVHPTDPTNATSASFTYTDVQAITKFQCSLDNGVFTDCGAARPSSKSYTGLGGGTHTFRVRAVGSGGTGSPTAFTWTVDRTAPTVASIVRADASPTAAASVRWTVTFSEPVTGVALGRFGVTASGFSGAPALTGLSGSGATYTLTASTGGSTTTDTASEALRLSTAGPIKDTAGNGLAGAPVAGPAYSVDKHQPRVVSIVRADGNPTKASIVHWTVTFSEPVSGVASNGSNFSLATTGLSGGPAATAASGAAASWTVAGSTGSGSGSVSVRLTSAGSIKDKLGNGIAGLPSSGPAYAIDRTPPPPPRIVFAPASPTTSTVAAFIFDETDPTAALACRLDSSPWTPCLMVAGFNGVANGRHTFSVVATDSVGNSSAPASWSWLVDTAAPTVQFDQTPSNPDTNQSPVFKFDAADPAPGTGIAAMQCKLDGAAWQTCASPRNLLNLTASQHTFSIRATDKMGNASAPLAYTWTISQQGLPFTVDGDAVGLLYPGGKAPIELTFTNPNDVPITVTSVTAQVTGTSDTSHCPVSGNFSIGQQLQGAVTVPANANEVSLKSLGVSQANWPTIVMPDPPADQDGCKNQTVSLTYTGSAHS
jgi:hypothetical protein